MAKQRLVDFRGGINKKISPHMIGDSQGQDAQDVDLSAVRLQGRKQIQGSTTDEKAQGTFFYEVGNVSTPGYWVSTDPKDSSYIDGASDFAVWNKDLYVSRIMPEGQTNTTTYPGTLLIYPDGATTPSNVSFNPPAAPEIELDYPTATDVLIASTSTNVLASGTISFEEYNPTGSNTVPTSGFTNSYPTASNENDQCRYFRWQGTEAEWEATGLADVFTSTGTYDVYGARGGWESLITPTTYYICDTNNNGTIISQAIYNYPNNAIISQSGSTITLVWKTYGVTYDYNNFSSGTYGTQRYDFYNFINGGTYTLSGGSSITATVGVVTIQKRSSTTSITTPAFTRDDSRKYIYSTYTSASNSWTTDLARGASNDGWLGTGASKRDFTGSTHGYYLSTVREQSSLPVLSQGRTQVSIATTSTKSNYISVGSFVPQRVDFDITAPTDSTDPLLGYQLEREDGIGSYNFGYINPDTSITLTGSGTSYTLTLPTAGTYRIAWYAYQNCTLSFDSGTTAKSDTTGVVFTTTSANETRSITLSEPSDDGYRGFDLWIEKRVLAGVTSSADTYAMARCFDVFETSSATTITGSDFLDVFSAGLSSGSLSSSGTSTNTAAPDYLKFLEESNNFFFGVGTEDTNPSRYASGNKKGSYLFVSSYNNPRDWPLTGYVEFDDEINGIHSYPGELIVWTQNGTYRVTGSRPEQMRKIKLATTEGMKPEYHNSIALVNNYLVWVSQSGICFYDGNSVTNLTRGRFETTDLPILNAGASIHAGQIDGRYYVVGSDETGFMVDFNLEGFPVTQVDLAETGTTRFTDTVNSASTTPDPVLYYKRSENQLYSRRGIIEGKTSRNLWDYQTRDFDGGAYGSIKLVKNIVLNGKGTGKVQIYLDGQPVFTTVTNNVTVEDPKTVNITTNSTVTEPVKVYLPAGFSTRYGVSAADVWSVKITDWSGQLDWIDTEYEILTS